MSTEDGDLKIEAYGTVTNPTEQEPDDGCQAYGTVTNPQDKEQ